MQLLDGFLLLQNHIIVHGGQVSAVLLKVGEALFDVIEILRDILDVHPSGVQPVVAKKESRRIQERFVMTKKRRKEAKFLLRLNLLLVARLRFQGGRQGDLGLLALPQFPSQALNHVFRILQRSLLAILRVRTFGYLLLSQSICGSARPLRLERL